MNFCNCTQCSFSFSQSSQPPINLPAQNGASQVREGISVDERLASISLFPQPALPALSETAAQPQPVYYSLDLNRLPQLIHAAVTNILKEVLIPLPLNQLPQAEVGAPLSDFLDNSAGNKRPREEVFETESLPLFEGNLQQVIDCEKDETTDEEVQESEVFQEVVDDSLEDSIINELAGEEKANSPSLNSPPFSKRQKKSPTLQSSSPKKSVRYQKMTRTVKNTFFQHRHDLIQAIIKEETREEIPSLQQRMNKRTLKQVRENFNSAAFQQMDQPSFSRALIAICRKECNDERVNPSDLLQERRLSSIVDRYFHRKLLGN